MDDLPLMYWDVEAPRNHDSLENGKITQLDIHQAHCTTCVRGDCDHFSRLTSKTGKQNETQKRNLDAVEEVCQMTACSRCGVKLHACKEEEHLEELCPEVIMPCINVDNGCDIMLKRRVRGIHLEDCPASILFCSVEWNRWPLHYTDKHSPLPFFLPNPQGTPDQLDIAFALRDQAMLNAAYSSPRHFRRMRNDLTERFPAVPLPLARPVPKSILESRKSAQAQNGAPTGKRAGSEASNGVSAHLSRDGSLDSDAPSILTSDEDFSWSDAPWQKQRNPPGLSRSMCSKLYQATRQTSESLKAALEMVTGHEVERDVENTPPITNGIRCHHDEENEMYDELEGQVYTSAEKGYGKKGDADYHQETDATKVHLLTNGCHPVKSVPVAPPPHVPVSLGLNLTVEAITRYQAKPKSMLTFVCGQSFRRSEYAAHYKNVHSEIQGGLTWVEQRCPLAQYGCPFSLRRLSPAPVSKLIHSSELRCFGVKRPYCDTLDVNLQRADFLTSLPQEVLVRVGGFLDDDPGEGPLTPGGPPIAKYDPAPVAHQHLGSLLTEPKGCIISFSFTKTVMGPDFRVTDITGFALNNLSRTSRRLRFLCTNLLEHQGMVQQEWIPVRSISGRTKWKIGFQRWTFSTAFEEVTRWRLGDESSGQHLSQCPFYHAVRQVEPIRLLVPDAKPISEEQLDRMKANAIAHRYSGSRDQIIEPLTQTSSDKTVFGEEL